MIAIAIIMAQEDALFILEDLRIAPVLALLLKPFRIRKKEVPRGQRLATALERLGPTYIKLGQALSTRSDLIGEEMALGLANLRDKLKPFPTDTAKQIVEDEFLKPIDQLFTSFSEPVAAASIAQVHKATTTDGRTVAVKILRPGIEEAFARDLDLFFWVAEIIEQRMRGLRRLKPIEVVRTFKESVFFELDLRFEAAAGSELAVNLAKRNEGFRVPEIDWNRTSTRVMTSSWIHAVPISDIEAIKAKGLDVNSILTKAARSIFTQVFYDGFFHADLHPGNLFVDDEGDIVAVDFGIMGRIDWHTRIFMAEILRGFVEEDYRRVAEMHFAAGYVPADKSIENFTQACRAVAQPIMGKPVNEISAGALLGQMFKIAGEFEMETQPQLLLLQKTMMLTEGVGRMLNPKLNTWKLAEPLIAQWASDYFGPKGKAKTAAREAHEIAMKLPSILKMTEATLERFSDPQGIRLHPDTVRAMQRERARHQMRWLRYAYLALIIPTLLAVAILVS
jgi:ubiquinone biosynthesis protein